jgi:dGTPase
VDALGAVLVELLADPVLAAVADFDGGHRSLMALKRTATVLIGRFVAEAITATRAAFGEGPLSRYDADLVVPAPLARAVRC